MNEYTVTCFKHYVGGLWRFPYKVSCQPSEGVKMQDHFQIDQMFWPANKNRVFCAESFTIISKCKRRLKR